jgi:hypothetical protein
MGAPPSPQKAAEKHWTNPVTEILYLKMGDR